MERQYLPDCWNDDKRMNYLFSAFRENRESNQNDWDTKMSFWSNCIETYCKHCKTTVLSSSEITRKFERNSVLPMGMNTVLKELVRSGKLILKDDFIASVEGSWLSWGANLIVGRPARWAFNSVVKGNTKIPEGTYIHQGILQDMSEQVLTRHYATSAQDCHNIVERAKFESSIADICGDETTRHLVLLNLRKLKKVTLAMLPDGSEVVKFSSSKTEAVSPLTETEIGIFKLQKTVASLEEQLGKISIEIREYEQQARLHIRSGLKTSAKNSLRKKKLSEQRLERRESTLNTLQELLDKIRSANTDRMIIEAYKAGSSALKVSLKENNLTPDVVDDTMSDVQEVMEMCNEINDAMVAGNQSVDDTVNLGLDLDESALEAELDALMNTPVTSRGPAKQKAEPESEKPKEDPLSGFPAVPASPPGTTVKTSLVREVLTS